MTTYKLDQKGHDFIAHLEGLRQKPYLDVVGVPTIGIGSTYYPSNWIDSNTAGKRVTINDRVITRDEAFLLFDMVSKNYIDAINAQDLNLNQNQFDALFALAYNIGVGGFKKSNLLRTLKVNPNDTKGVTNGFMGWNHPAVLQGRRKEEIALYFTPLTTSEAIVDTIKKKSKLIIIILILISLLIIYLIYKRNARKFNN
jgi:lysozyme